MLLLKLLNIKPSFTKTNGDVVTDLSRGSFQFPQTPVTSVQAYIVGPVFGMRADKVANSIYNDQNQLDILLKYNGISNPFAINPGDVLYAPALEVLQSYVTLTPEITDHAATAPAAQTVAAATTQDATRLASLPTTAAPNNQVPANNTSVSINNGQISFGEDVTTIPSSTCAQSVSRAQLLQTLITNKIFSSASNGNS